MRGVIVVPHDVGWADAYGREAQVVRDAMGAALVELSHIGSTAVPGLAAKPVIDMLAVVSDLAALDARSAAIESLGYQVMGEFGIPTRRYFRKDDAAGVRTHQVHAFALGSPHVGRHVAFRDYLRAHPAVAAEYGALKQRLAAAHPHDIEAYMDGKDAFIKETEARALAWSQAAGAVRNTGRE